MSGLLAHGGYVPRLRLQRAAVARANAWLAPGLAAKARGERSMGNWDEDALTFAVEAARDALGPGDDRSHIRTILLATTTAPFADRLNAGIVAAALTLDPGVAASDITGTQRAGLTALAMGLRLAEAGSGPVLVAAGERRIAKPVSAMELDTGDAGAAMVAGAGDGVIAEWIGHAVSTVDFVDHFRGSGETFDYAWEERWIRDEGLSKIVPPVLADALASAGVAPGAVTHFILPSTFKGLPQAMARKAGIPEAAVRDTLGATLGEAGSAQALVMLSHALETAQPGAIILAAQFGQGCEALVFRVTDAITRFRPVSGVSGWLARGRAEESHLKLLVFTRLVDWDKGMRAERDAKTALSTLHRYSDQIMGLVGGRCTVTGTVQFPRSRLSVAPNAAGVDTQEPYRFAERAARVLTWSADHLTYTPSPPNHYGQIDFEGGGRIFMDITDVDPGDVDTGTPVRMAFRVKDWDERRGFTRYFWKAVPVRD